MQPVLYTDTNQIRAVLGVDENDVTDMQIVQRNLDKELRIDLGRWLSTHADINSAGVDIAATETEITLNDALILYCTYFCALLVGQTLAMAAPQSISDGKNTLKRFDTPDWRQFLDNIRERMASARKYLEDATTPTSTGFSLFSVAGSDYDPVTG